MSDLLKNSVKYCILDVARIGVQIQKALEMTAESDSLYDGDIRENLADVAPYLLKIDDGSAALEWIIENGYGNSWGIFLDTDEDFQTVRKHLRKFLIVENQEGKRMFFRFYDPRVIKDFLPTCSGGQTEEFFGNITKIIVENPDKGNFLVFGHKRGSLEIGTLEINEGELGKLDKNNTAGRTETKIQYDSNEEITII